MNNILREMILQELRTVLAEQYDSGSTELKYDDRGPDITELQTIY